MFILLSRLITIMPGLYIHIPFCVRKCPYCDFYSEAETEVSIPEFLRALRTEIELRAENWIIPDPAETLFFGGGTPSLLSANQLSIILHYLRDSFAIQEFPEITVEANPGTLSPEKLEGYRQEGVNRLSIGAQSFLNAELDFLGRIHRADEISRSVRAAREAGFGNIGLDLIFGLPDQTLSAWRVSVHQALELEPEHISTYALTWDNETPIGKRIQSGELPAPDESRVSDMYLWTSEILRSAGYAHYEVSNFARPGFRCRHNEGYWTGRPYLGLGPSAHSFLHEKRSWNLRDIREYIHQLRLMKLPVEGEEELSYAQRKMERLALLLRRSDGIPLDELPGNPEKLDPFFSEGLASIRDGRFALTPRGFLLADGIALRLAD
ncbi:MAG TPA: radical SAM family heme chaperone HemW [bacterium]|nr:radical SAM family heme chaperone HemW [bacterium]